MAEITLEMLGALVERVIEGNRRLERKFDRMAEDMSDLKQRMSAVEEAVIGQTRRIDRFEVRLDRVEARFDLSDGE